MVYKVFHFSDWTCEELMQQVKQQMQEAAHMQPTPQQRPIADRHFGGDSYQVRDVEVQWMQSARPQVRVSISAIGYCHDFGTEEVAKLLYEAEGTYHGDSRQMLVAILINKGLIPAPVQVCKYRL